MITEDIIKRVFQIKIGDNIGTCFAIEKDNRQYIVTARHVLINSKVGDKIKIFHENTWKDIQIQEIRTSISIDIATFSVNVQLCSTGKTYYTSDRIIISQDVYFLGFPYGKSWSLGNAFIKKAIVSAIINPYIILDGHNNPGFSGGPVVFVRGGSFVYGKPQDYSFSICSVICGFESFKSQVYSELSKTDLFIRENTGIINSCDIKNAIDLINEPFGFVLK